MTVAPIGFYVHHEGRGHLERTRAIVAAVEGRPCVVATSHPEARDVLAGTDVTVLDDDVGDGGAGDVTANGTFHWAPELPLIGARRQRQMADWVLHHRPALAVVDVSVEVAVALRLMGVRVVAMRLAGHRDDAAHRLGYQVADALLAPFAEIFEDPATPSSIVERTTYCGQIAPDHPMPTPPLTSRPGRRRSVLVLWGQGTSPPTGPSIDAAALATPDWDWTMIGPPCPVRPPAMVTHLGWRDDAASLATEADVVIGAPGDGTLGLVAAAQARFVAIPRPRPFDEQVATGARLARLGLAEVVTTWPPAGCWPDILGRAMDLDPDRLKLLGAVGAARRAAAHLEAMAHRPSLVSSA